MIGNDFVMPDPEQQNSLEDKLNREDQLADAVDTFSAPPWSAETVKWWAISGACVATILVFAFWGLIAN